MVRGQGLLVLVELCDVLQNGCSHAIMMISKFREDLGVARRWTAD